MPDKVKTDFTRAKVGVQPRPLGKGRMVSVVIQNTLTNMDNTPNNQEVMVGGANGQPHQLLPGERSEEIFAIDLENVWARVRDQIEVIEEEDVFVDGTPVDVTLIIFKEQDQ